MFRFCAADVLSWNQKNVISRCLIVSNYNCSRVRLCHAPRLGETIIHHHETKGRNLHPKPARSVVNETFQSISQKLKLPFLKPVYTTIPIHGEGRAFKTVLTLKWPEKQSFEAIGQNKRELEELVAKQALTALQDSNIISATGKLVCELNTHKTFVPPNSDEPTQPSVTENEEEFATIEAQFPNYKSTLLNCFMKISNHMKDANFIARPTFKHLKRKTNSKWQASYNLKWPEAKEFLGEGTTRAEAEKRAILSSLNWLMTNNYLHKDGYPNLYSKEELQELKKNTSSPASVKLSPVLVEELEEVLNDFKNLKPLLDENRAVFEREIAAKSLIPEDEEGIEEVEEELELEESLGNLPISSTNEWKCDDNEEVPVDPLTGRRFPVLSPAEIKKRCDELYRSAQMRLVEKTGPVIPHLPIAEKRDEILDLIENNRVVVLSGDTGCGKSTQMPQYLLDSYALKHRGTDCNIIVTQPRRLAALSLAQTVAGHRGEKVGDSVGYQVRLNSVLPSQQQGRILFCSTGILLRRLQACPNMLGISHLIIDEVHERDCLTDFTLVIIKDLLRTNPLLKVILMSASLNADLLSRYFDSAPLTHVSGRAFPVQKRFLSEIRQLTQSSGSRITNAVTLKPMVDQDLLVKLVRYIDHNKPSQGSILVFLPGWADIKNLHSKLKEFYPSEETHWILPVHSRLSQTEQERIFDRPPEGVRKIVLATNIAETSLTIPDCVYVIDPGVHKELRYNSQRGTAVMENQWVSKANVQQRAGRAGRVQPGESFHLYSQEKYEEMEPFPQAEILRIPLEKVVMDIKAYDENLKSVDFLSRTLEPPTHRAIYDAIQELQSISALDEYERLTPLGRRIAQFSTHPRLAKSLVFATLFRCLDPVASIVAGLSSAREGWSVESTVDKQRQVIRQAKNRFHSTSDHLALSNLVKQFRKQRGRYEVDEFCDRFQANAKSLYFLRGVRSLLVDHLKDANLLNDRLDADSTRHPVNMYADNEEMVKAALLMGFGDRILRVRKGRMIKGMIKSNETVILSEKHGPVHIVPDSVNADFKRINSDFVFYFNGIFSTERKAFVVRDTTQISNIATLLTAGKSIANDNLNSRNDSVNIVVDGSKNLKFACLSRESELLMGLRYSLGETCDFLLRTAGSRQTNDVAATVGKFHGRQIELLSRLLSPKDDFE